MGELLRDDIHLRLGNGQRHIRFLPHDNQKATGVTAGGVFVSENERHVHVRVTIKLETEPRGSNADDGVRGAVENDGLANDFGIGCVVLLSVRIAENHFAIAFRLLLARFK